MAVGLGLAEGVRTEEPGWGSVCRTRTCDTCGRGKSCPEPEGTMQTAPGAKAGPAGPVLGGGVAGRLVLVLASPAAGDTRGTPALALVLMEALG